MVIVAVAFNSMSEENNEMPNSNKQQEHHPNDGHDDHNNQDMENNNMPNENSEEDYGRIKFS
ncbi:hypothetical protein [Spiroplasma endosymbiont of Agriotes lineatus]|uniref:hypothetical protein n=1 Tax=Spiroplasma endosymbiont of Agriotes lineatus TaxID=3077930 RepID=UPI0030CAE5EE